jgi:hypothetical protein
MSEQGASSSQSKLTKQPESIATAIRIDSVFGVVLQRLADLKAKTEQGLQVIAIN